MKLSLSRVRGALADMSYAQGRLFELRTGIPSDETSRRERSRQVRHLDAIYDLEAVEPREPATVSDAAPSQHAH